MAERKSTLGKTLQHIIHIQSEYFMGDGEVVPMKLEDIAQALNLNISTISRAIHKKHIHCCYGVIELKSLFTKSLSNNTGEKLSSTTVKEKIKKLIATEDRKKPLSDDHMVAILNTMNIHVSRRTIAKYRNEMNISNSTSRKII